MPKWINDNLIDGEMTDNDSEAEVIKQIRGQFDALKQVIRKGYDKRG